MTTSHIPSRDGPGLVRLRASARGEEIRQCVLRQQEEAKSAAAQARLQLTSESAQADTDVKRQPMQSEYPYPVGTYVEGETFRGVVWAVLGPLGHTLAIHGGEEIVPASLVTSSRAPSPQLRKILRQLRDLGFV